MNVQPARSSLLVGFAVSLMAVGFSGLIAVLFFPNLPDSASPPRKMNRGLAEEVEIASAVADVRIEKNNAKSASRQEVEASAAESPRKAVRWDAQELPNCKLLQRFLQSLSSKN